MSREDGMLGRSQWAVLALLAEQPSHGWALSRLLETEGEIGQIWGGDRHGVYRALRTLDGMGLIEEAGIERGEGGHRTIYHTTSAGQAAVEQWLAEPVEHVRDINSTFLLKLAFAQRSGLDVRPLLAQQREILVGVVEELGARVAALPAEDPGFHLRLRLEIAQTVLRFLDSVDLPASRTRLRKPRPATAGSPRSGGGTGRGRGDGSGSG